VIALAAQFHEYNAAPYLTTPRVKRRGADRGPGARPTPQESMTALRRLLKHSVENTWASLQSRKCRWSTTELVTQWGGNPAALNFGFGGESHENLDRLRNV
jgi:hypothetical protein